MSRCTAAAVNWKNRRGYRLSNGAVEVTVLLGGGHITDVRLCGSRINALWEAPWPTIEPQTFTLGEHTAIYGDGAVGKFLSGYTGHALALGYFGMPSSAEERQGLPLHGEAAAKEWKIVSANADDHSATVATEVSVVGQRLLFCREISLPCEAFAASIKESVTNLSGDQTEFQWVEHASFGEPLFVAGEAALFVSASRGVTWPGGYEGYELLSNDVEFRWPHARSMNGELVDLSQPFIRDGTGFVVALLAERDRENAFVAVHNRKHKLVAGYCFDPKLFPWVALWEENRAREYAPWNARTRVRGVEFGTSPMPLGLDHARKMQTLFETPVLISIPGGARIETQYSVFVHSAPPHWTKIKDVSRSKGSLVVRGDRDEEIKLETASRNS